MSSRTQDGHAEQSAEQRRRKRQERAAKSRTPEPKDIVSGAGQPLDPGVRRELEERLGHDLSRVRLHTGRDAGQLTELLGADAVAVGQDVFFAEGTFKPGTDEGRRLLAHELLHTVQNPHGLGTLRAGREPGAVSLPQQAIEREAEAAARDVVREPEAGPETADVEQDQATPGWLRYATVDADRNRAEAMDPATLVDRIANGVVRSLRGDPEDLSHRTRKQLARLPEQLLDGVLVRLENRLLAPEHDRVLDFVDEVEAYDDHAEALERNAHDAPQVEPDVAEEVRTEREEEWRAAQERKTEDERPALAPGPEKEQADEEGAAGSTPRNGGTAEHGTTPEGGGAPRGPQSPGAGSAGSVGSAGASRSAGAEAGKSGSAGSASPGGQSSSGSASEGKSQGGGQKPQAAAGGKAKTGKDGAGKEATERKVTPAASKEESAARNRAGAAEAMVAGRQLRQQDKRGQDQPKSSPTTSGKDTQLAGRSSTLEGKRNQDVEGLEEETEDGSVGSGSDSEVEVGGAEPSAWDVKLQPEDFLPTQDLDTSGVPTADESDPSSSATPSVPSFATPPPTRADEVQAQRDAEDAEDEAAEAEPEEETLAEDTGSSSAPETEGGPRGDGGFGGLALEQAAALPVTSAANRDPKAGDDPKVGAVAAQTTVQEAPGKAGAKSEGGSEAKEPAAKEEKGTAAAGDKAAAAPEKESQQATGGRSAPTEAGAGAGQKESASGAGSEAAQDTAGAAGGTSSAGGTGGVGGPGVPGGTAGAPEAAPSGGTTEESAPESGARAAAPATRTQTPAAAPKSAPAAQESVPAPAPRTAPEEKGAPESAPAPKAAPSGGSSGSGGGGGGAAAPARGKGKKDSGPAPNLSGLSPEAGLSTASKLKPHKALQAMGGVGGAVGRTVGDEHQTLASAPPSMQRPAGAPRTLEGKPKTDAPAEYAQDPAQQAKEPDQENAEVTGEKEPEGQIEAEKAEEPGGWDTFKMALGFIGGKIVNGVASLFGADEPVVDPQELAAKFAGLPTKDEALKQAQAGNAPGVEMQGGAEQASGEQGSNVDAKGQETMGTAQDDAGRGMGEDQVYPNAPKEHMAAKIPGQGSGGEGAGVEAGGATGAVPPEAASELAEHERGPQFQAAFSEGHKGMSEGRQAKDRDFRDSQAKHKQQVDAEIAANTETQAGEREKAMADVTAQREGWRTEQDKELKSLGDKKTDRQEKVRQDVKDEEKKTDDKVDTEKEGSDKKIKERADNAEKDADRQKNNAAQESGNWLSKAFDWLKQKVIEIKNAIVRVIREARDAVITFIRDFKKNVEGWINAARKSIVDAIRNLIKDLIEFAISMVRAVIDLAKRIRNLITSLINAAIALVNRLATALKQAISDLLDSIGKLLSSILEILKKALLDVVKAVVDAVKAVLDFAAGLLNALGEFMLIAVDFLSDPGGWLSGAKNSAVDGAKNHLFREVKAAVKEWFQSKIEEIIGVPRAILDKLIKGGITLEQIVKETWDAIVPQLPFIIGEIVITKVIAKLIPGAGWVMAVIDAIKTAIGALGEILRAMGAVLNWLKAVRSGAAGILFAKAVAAGIVALLELAYEALLSGIGKYVAKVGRRFRGLAERLGRGKNGKGDGKKPAAGGTDDKGGRRDDRTSTDDKPETGAPTVRPTSVLPKPGRGPGSVTKPKAKPGPKADPKKPSTKTPGTDTAAGPGRPGRPKSESQGDKPDTRPTPAPKPRKPKPEPKPDTRPQDADGRAPHKPGDDKDSPGTSKPQDDSRSADKPREQEPNRPKDDGKDTPGKPKGDKGDPGRTKPDTDSDGVKPRPKDDRNAPGKPKPTQKPDKDGPGAPKRKPDRHGPGKTKPDKSGPGRPKSRPDKDRQKKDENSEQSKNDRLRKIVARIRPIINAKLDRGIAQDDHQAMRERLRAHYRLTALSKSNDQNFGITARLNPSQPVTNGYTGSTDRIDYRRPPGETAPALPPTKLPPFTNGPVKAPSFKAHHIHEPLKRGTEAEDALDALPVGWEMVADERGPDGKPYSAGGKWVRMHLLPAPLGGDATTSNLVPARGAQNKEAAIAVEHPAARALGKEVRKSKWKGKLNNMIWYDVNVSYYSDDKFPGFPSSIKVMWGGYSYTGSHWKRDPATVTWPRNFMPPPEEHDYAPHTADVNRDDVHALRRATGISMYFAERIVGLRKTRTFDNMTALAKALKKDEHLYSGEKDETLTGGSHKNKTEAIRRLRRAAKNKWLTF
ncbi:eCIS core domain-containing protein [Streptomyces chartreusis]|uniref:eCIS core domain-containing protein n=1 Tax=Streptomyces chartreusis TaxID=1969 RepID=UPI0035E1EBDB